MVAQSPQTAPKPKPPHGDFVWPPGIPKPSRRKPTPSSGSHITCDKSTSTLPLRDVGVDMPQRRSPPLGRTASCSALPLSASSEPETQSIPTSAVHRHNDPCLRTQMQIDNRCSLCDQLTLHAMGCKCMVSRLPHPSGTNRALSPLTVHARCRG
ncbi:hypothetical protein BJV74DRAFT_843701 [Russula compacta]|nr:hypothetical protein BJV74DRAFT_843701 [Russula compacta]